MEAITFRKKRWDRAIVLSVLQGLCPLVLGLICGTVSTMLSYAQVQAAPHHIAIANTYVDTVLVIDNVSQIATFDSAGERFTAARLFVDLTPPGDRVGIVGITSSPDPAATQPLPLQDVTTDAGRNNLRTKLASFGKVDTNPTAYITPALQEAGKLLGTPTATRRKYIVIITDAVAESGDTTACTGYTGDQYHHWFCEVTALRQQSIAVILMGFLKPGTEGAFKPTEDFIQREGGTVLTVGDGAGLLQDLAERYTDLLTRTHANLFSAQFTNAPASLSIDPILHLKSITFVAIGIGTRGGLDRLQIPGGEEVPNASTSGQFYISSGKNSVSSYWLATITSGELAGTWQLSQQRNAASIVLVLGTSEASLTLLNPTPSDPASAVSARLIAQQEDIALRTRVTVDDEPTTTIPLVANVTQEGVPFNNTGIATDAFQDSASTDKVALLDPFTETEKTISIGLGHPLAQDIYLAQSFQLVASPALSPAKVQVNVPAAPANPPVPGTNIMVSTRGAQGVDAKALVLFSRETADDSWNVLGNNSTPGASLNVPFPLLHGCGTRYQFAVVQEISGKSAQGQYDYLVYATEQFISQLQANIVGTAHFSTGKYLEWWSTQAGWSVDFTSTACSDQSVTLYTTLARTEQRLSLRSSPTSVVIPRDGSEHARVLASVDACSLSLFRDRDITLQLQADTTLKKSFLAGGTWQEVVTCPSLMTNAWRYPLEGGGIFILFLILVVRCLQLPLLPFASRPHFDGWVIVERNATPAARENRRREKIAIPPITIPLPRSKPEKELYLLRYTEQDRVFYGFETWDSENAVLKFMISKDGKLAIAAASGAKGALIPVWCLHPDKPGSTLGLTPVPYNGAHLIIGPDLIYMSHLSVKR